MPSKTAERRRAFMREAFESMREGIEATCSKCGGAARIYPGGLFCETCSPPGMLDFVKGFRRTNGGYQKVQP